MNKFYNDIKKADNSFWFQTGLTMAWGLAVMLAHAQFLAN